MYKHSLVHFARSLESRTTVFGYHLSHGYENNDLTRSSNGRTTVFGAVNPGSSPGRVANGRPQMYIHLRSLPFLNRPGFEKLLR